MTKEDLLKDKADLQKQFEDTRNGLNALAGALQYIDALLARMDTPTPQVAQGPQLVPPPAPDGGSSS